MLQACARSRWRVTHSLPCVMVCLYSLPSPCPTPITPRRDFAAPAHAPTPSRSSPLPQSFGGLRWLTSCTARRCSLRPQRCWPPATGAHQMAAQPCAIVCALERYKQPGMPPTEAKRHTAGVEIAALTRAHLCLTITCLPHGSHPGQTQVVHGDLHWHLLQSDHASVQEKLDSRVPVQPGQGGSG